MRQVSQGAGFRCLLKMNGAVDCVGTHNYNGQLGFGETDGNNEKWSGGRVLGLGPQILQIASGHEHTCAVAASGKLYCWGGNQKHQLSEHFSGSRSSATLIEHVSDVRQVVTDLWHTCALTHGGDVYC